VAQLVAESMPKAWFGPKTKRAERILAPSDAGESRIDGSLILDPELQRMRDSRRSSAAAE
jgi:hypothetical protein